MSNPSNRLLTGGKFTLLPSVLLSLKPTKSCWTSSLSCWPSCGSRVTFRSYRSRAQWTERLLSSTPATMFSTASQSSLLRMLPVLSDKLSMSPTPKGASDFSSVGEESCCREQWLSRRIARMSEGTNHGLTTDSSLSYSIHTSLVWGASPALLWLFVHCRQGALGPRGQGEPWDCPKGLPFWV